MRIFYRCPCVSVRCGTHTGLIGKQTSGHAVADGLPNSNTCGSAKDCLRVKSSHQNLPQRFRYLGNVQTDQQKTSYNINACHKGHDFFHNSGKSFGSSQKYKSCRSSYDNADGNLGHVNSPGSKNLSPGRSDGIGLHHISHKSQSQYQKQREDCCQYFPCFSLKRCLNIVNRSSGHFPFVHCFIFLSQSSFRINGCHSEKSGNPHPENSSRSAADQRRSRSCQISGSHLSRYGSSDRLKRGHFPFFSLFPFQAEMPEYSPARFAELSHLNKAQFYGIKDTCTAQHK